MSRSRIAAATTRLVDVEGRSFRVCDGLFDERTIREIHELVRACPFLLNNADSPDDAFNLRWKSEFTAEQCARHRFFADVLALIGEEFSGRHLQLDRIYANANAFGDLFYPHTDGDSGREGITALYFANLRWDLEWGAETSFYAAGEPAYVVAPRPGRMLVFDAKLTHRGAAPTRPTPEPRWSIAFKISDRP